MVRVRRTVTYLLGTHHHCPGAEPAEAGVPREAIRGEVMTVEGEDLQGAEVEGVLEDHLHLCHQLKWTEMVAEEVVEQHRKA